MSLLGIAIKSKFVPKDMYNVLFEFNLEANENHKGHV